MKRTLLLLVVIGLAQAVSVRADSPEYDPKKYFLPGEIVGNFKTPVSLKERAQQLKRRITRTRSDYRQCIRESQQPTSWPGLIFNCDYFNALLEKLVDELAAVRALQVVTAAIPMQGIYPDGEYKFVPNTGIYGGMGGGMGFPGLGNDVRDGANSMAGQ